MMRKIFPKSNYQKKSSLEIDEIITRLDSLRKSKKYEGFWNSGFLYLEKNTPFGASNINFITPNIIVEVIDGTHERVVSVNFEMKHQFELIMRIILVLFSLLILTLLIAFVIKRTFDYNIIFLFFLPPLIYLILKIGNQWDADGFRYDLNKILKDTRSNL